MKYFLTKKNSYQIDNFFINEIGIESKILMENAAHSTFNKMLQLSEIEYVRNVLILCGSGNNGGDGFALARYLSNEFYVDIYFNSNEDKMSEETRANYNICKKLGLTINNQIIDKNYDLVIESMVGIGVDENINTELEKILQKINQISGVKIAIDSPAGINVDNGNAHKNAFKADYTFSMFSSKIGFYFNQAKDYIGKVVDVNLGTPDRYLSQFTKYKALDELDLISIHKPRKSDSSKFDYGRIAIIAGSRNMLGAGTLAANAAINTGAGLVHLISTNRHSQLLPEIICHTFDENKYGSLPFNKIDEILEITSKADTILIGPGLSNDNEVLRLTQKIIEENQEKKIILDADALKCLDIDSELGSNFIITPHTGEMASITNLERTYIENNRISVIEEWSRRLNCCVLLKGNPSLISNSSEVYINLTGNAGLATAGSGDVLSGILAAIYSKYDNPIISAAISAYIHGKIADDYTKNYSQSSLTASKIINELKNYEI